MSNWVLLSLREKIRNEKTSRKDVPNQDLNGVWHFDLRTMKKCLCQNCHSVKSLGSSKKTCSNSLKPSIWIHDRFYSSHFFRHSLFSSPSFLLLITFTLRPLEHEHDRKNVGQEIGGRGRGKREWLPQIQAERRNTATHLMIPDREYWQIN